MRIALLVSLAAIDSASGQTINVSNTTDLNDAIQTIDSNPNVSYTLNLNANFTMNQSVPGINTQATVTLSGNSSTVDGANLFQPLVIDHGTVLLQNLNIVHPGEPIRVNGGTLIDNTGSLQGAVVNNGAVVFNAPLSDTYSGNMSGSGNVEIRGKGPVLFSGVNSYTGGTVIDKDSALYGTTTSLQGSIKTDGLLEFLQSTSGTFGGVISGTGGVEVAGGGQVTFSGLNTYSGGTYVTKNGALTGTTDTVQGTIFNQGYVQFNQSTAGTYAGNLSGIGGVQISGGGQVTFSGLNTYKGGTGVDLGSTLIGNTKSVQGAIWNNGTVQFNQDVSGTYGGGMTGTGRVMISGSGPVTFGGTNSYSGGTLVDQGSTLIGTTSSLQGAFTNNGLVQFKQTNGGAYTDNMSGSGGVKVSGPGAVHFSGSNSYTGGTTIDSGSLLSGTTSSLQGMINNNGGVQFNQGTSGIYSGNLSGTGFVQISNTGGVTFRGTNTYSGGTIVDQGATLIGSTTSLQRNFNNNGILKFVNLQSSSAFLSNNNPIMVPASSQTTPSGSASITAGTNGIIVLTPVPSEFGGNISGTGSVVFGASGTTTLTGNNHYSGGTTVDVGTTLVGTTSSLQGNFTNNGFVQFNNNLGIRPESGLWVTPDTTILGANSGISTTNNAGSSLVNPNNIAIGQAGTYGGNMSGTGGVEISGAGSITFSGTNSYTGGTSVDSGSMLIGTTNSIQGMFVNNGAIGFNQSSSGTFGGNISGVGSVLIDGSGPVTFSGTNTYTGGTSVSSGSTLIGTTRSLQGSIFDSGLVQFNQTTAGTYSGIISGTGGVEIGGVGPITFTGANVYTGGTVVDNGSTLIVGSTGSIAGNVNVNNGGTLMGEGNVGSTTVNAGGTVYPGTVGAPITVHGNFTQNTGSTYTAELNPTGSDKIIVTGAATVSAATTLNLVVDPGIYTVGSKYQILTAAGGLTGTYSNLATSTYSQNVLFSEKYGPNNLLLVVNSNLSNSSLTSNQAAVATLLDQASGTATGNFAIALTQLTTLNTNPLSGALNQISGDIYANISTIERQTTNVQMQLLSNRLAGLTGPGIPAVGVAQRQHKIRFVSSSSSDAQGSDSSSTGLERGSQNWTSWAQGYGLGGNVAGDGNASGSRYRLGGTLFGAERWLNESTMFGVLGGYAGTSVGDHRDGSTAQISAYQAGLYELFRHDSFYVSNIDLYGNNSYNVSRPLRFGSVNQAASGSYSGNQWAHYTELGTTFELDDIRLQPFTGMQYMHLDQNGFTETGAGSLNLTTDGQTVDSVRNGIGARLSTETMWSNVLVVPTLSAQYQHEWGNGTQLISSSFSGVPTAQFITTGDRTGRDFGLFTLNATAYLTERFSLYGTVNAQVASRYHAIIGSGGFQYSW